MDLNFKQKEILLIAQEECAEVTQAISKIFRFGIDACHPNTMKSNSSHLAEELGDLLAMIELSREFGIVKSEDVEIFKTNKIEKLKKWSKIFEG